MKNNFCINEHVSTILPTENGWFNFYVWKSDEGKETVVLTTKKLDPNQPVTIRIHSECLTGDIFHSTNCDCGFQKDEALRMIQESKNGLFLYDRQEGRGIGLFEKIKALNLQKDGMNTYEANEKLGFGADIRNYDIPIQILKYFDIHDIKIITNNPQKIKALKNAGFNITERIKVKKDIDKYNEKYLTEKKNLGHHLFE